jgi:UDP-N-acetylglucosamine 2-epimerase
MKFCSIVGARPNFIKLAPISKEIRKKYTEIIIHTGQHYDDKMSGMFFKDMHIPLPDYNLNVQESTHGKQIGNMIVGIEEVLMKENPDVVIVFGDTNSTLAGAIASVKLNIPVAHIEAGCRSYDMSMPEEQNRIMVDHISKFLYAPTSGTARILQDEDVNGAIYDYGDVSVDILHALEYKSTPSNSILATIHRPVNADSHAVMNKILSALNETEYEVIFPVHPRTNKTLENFKLKEKYSNIKYVDPMNYNDIISHIKSAKMVITDSGGIQKESYILRTPCITLRDTTEWVETLNFGWNVIVPSISKLSILDAIKNCKKPSVYIDCFGSPGVSGRIIKSIAKGLNEGITN